jgi:hypothetical protein
MFCILLQNFQAFYERRYRWGEGTLDPTGICQVSQTTGTLHVSIAAMKLDILAHKLFICLLLEQTTESSNYYMTEQTSRNSTWVISLHCTYLIYNYLN